MSASPQPAGAAKEKVPVLCVDDEQAVLEGLALHLRRRFTVHLAQSGAAALEILSREGIAVVISDMRMPGMDGAAFLAKARALAPNAVRILLTGQADMASAVAAVNEGQLFRFLTKPCPPPALLAAVEAAAEQNRLIHAEKVLLEQTLRGSVQALTEVLALTSPASFGRATRIRQLVSRLCARLAIPDAWQVEMAAMLSQLGHIILPPETVDRVFHGQQLSEAEQQMLARAPAVTEQLLGRIPRLEGVRAILGLQPKLKTAAPRTEGAELVRAAGVLLLASDFDALEMQGSAAALAIELLRGRKNTYDPAALEALAAERGASAGLQEAREVTFSGLRVGMVLAEDLRLKNETLVLTRGFELTASSLERLANFQKGIKEPIRVLLPAAGSRAA